MFRNSAEVHTHSPVNSYSVCMRVLVVFPSDTVTTLDRTKLLAVDANTSVSPNFWLRPPYGTIKIASALTCIEERIRLYNSSRCFRRIHPTGYWTNQSFQDSSSIEGLSPHTTKLKDCLESWQEIIAASNHHSRCLSIIAMA